eukprot:TRINITY_DN1_c1_g1_i1.p1 TRINITY_DN1_c1_g1~~TRINITY_DN1_c1_g1_i1.p1  ORF type:complete len:157 (+),score=28.09 TRINITY_DN1_c1_g1_i1:70-471(+)
MGHGDELVIADGNFPSYSQNVPVVPAHGLTVCQILSAIMHFLPLDTYDDAVIVMAPVPNDVSKFQDGKPPIWSDYEKIIQESEGENHKLKPIDRFEFYDRAKKSFAVVATSETAIYANIILKKGVISPPPPSK